MRARFLPRLFVSLHQTNGAYVPIPQSDRRRGAPPRGYRLQRLLVERRMGGRRLLHGAAGRMPPRGACPHRLRCAHLPLAGPQLRHRRALARGRRHGARVPPRLPVRQRSAGGDDERRGRPHGENLHRALGPDGLSGGPLPPPPAACRRAGAHGRGGGRARTLGVRTHRLRLPHHDLPPAARGADGRPRGARRRLAARERHALRRGPRRHRRQGARLHRRRAGAARQRRHRRTLLYRRVLPARQGILGHRRPLLRLLALRERRGGLHLRWPLHRLAPPLFAAHRRNVLLLQRRQRHQPEQPPLQERRRTSGRPPAGLQVRQRRLRHVAGARRGLHHGDGPPHPPPRHLGLPLLVPHREGGALGADARGQPGQLRHGA